MTKNSEKNKIVPMYKLGKYLKNLREDLGLSMHEVARRSSLTPSYISKIESGNVFKTVSAQALVEFSKVYNIPPGLIIEKMNLIQREEDELPGLAPYLRIKYGATANAVQEMEIAWRIVKEKHMPRRKIT